MIKELDRIFMDLRAIADRRDEVDQEDLETFDERISRIHRVCHDCRDESMRTEGWKRRWSLNPAWGVNR